MTIKQSIPVLLTLVAAVALVVPATAGVVISEVDYDQPSGDSAEWVELYNPDATPMSLVGFDLVLINGSGGGCAEYGRFDLDAITIPAGGFVVVGNHACADASVTFPASNAIQNGAPDTILIEDGSATVVDGVEYENAGPANCGGAATAEADDPNADPDGSLQLCGGVWTYATSTACAAPGCGPVSTSIDSWGTLKSRY